ncbi:MAG: DUF192 domain-containing protein, partial [Hyphomicrobiaceae bacterium]|nr:DUF192 domain-containing protein [Hyphomicrobiaceae bacterium]
MLMLVWAPPLAAKVRVEQLWLITSSGQEHSIEVEVATALREKQLGLMFRTHLADGKGMLFPYESPQEVTMWMRNTYIPLDMLFIGADGKIAHIAQRTTPHSLET